MGRPTGPPGQARQRVLDAALELFAEHGVSGTSLQMIADRLGVTKAAVYHQFHAKDEIALALLEPLFAEVAVVVKDAEAAQAKDQLEVVLLGLVAAIFDQRQRFGALSRDPELERQVKADPEFQALILRLQALLLGDDPETGRRIAVTLFTAGVTSCAIDPNLADIEDEVMRRELDRLAGTLIESLR